MIPLNDIKQLVDVYGKDIFANPRRVYAILSDWHPRQKVSFDEVQDTCQKWQKGKISLSAEGNPSAIATIIGKAKSLIMPNGKASAGGNIIETVVDVDATTVRNSTGTGRNTNTAKPNPKPIKPTINTNPIDIKIDTSKSFRGGF